MKMNPDLPNELVEEILSRLPAKSLMKLKWVSKSWLSLISCPGFIKTHLALSSKRDDFHSLILTLEPPGEDGDYHLRRCSVSSGLYAAPATTTEVADIDYPIEIPGKSLVAGSCNGLICTCFEEKDLFLWNPCTQKFKKLPDISVKMDDNYCRYNMNFGFGYDDRNDDYKVIRLFCISAGPASEYKTEVEVYSLKKNSWNRIGDTNGFIDVIGSGYYASRNLHWLANSGENGWKILSLDLANETNGEMGIPKTDGYEPYFSIGVFGGNLSLLFQGQATNGVHVWVMTEYGVYDSWTELYFASFLDNPGTWEGISFPVCTLRDGKVLLVMLEVLVLYDPESHTCRWYPQTSRVKDVILFVESLVSPDLYLEEPRQL